MNTVELRALAEREIRRRAIVEETREESLDAIFREMRLREIALDVQGEELRRTQIELEGVLERYANLYELSPIAYVTLDRVGQILECNRASERLLGLPRQFLIRRPLCSVMSEEGADSFRLHLRRTFELGGPQQIEVSILRPGEDPCPTLIDSVVPARRDHCLATLLDLSEKRKAEAGRREAEARFRELSEQIEDVFFLYAPSTGTLLYVNPAFERVFGRSARAGQDLRRAIEWVHPNDRRRVIAAVEQFMSGNSLDLEVRILLPSGAVRSIRARAFAAGGDRVAGLISDVTDELTMEEELRQAQKMEAVGGLASGIAHDFNNLLMGIVGFANVALMRAEPGSASLREIKRVVEIARRGETLTRQLLDFSRKRPSQPERINLDAVVSSCKPLLETIVGETIRVSMKTEAPGGRVLADAGEIEQMLMNLATNARDAMGAGGVFSIATHEVFITDEIDLHSGRYLCLFVRDTGCGMDEPTQRRIFEPFFTTKEVGHGTGLGLSTTFRLVRRMGGHIRVTSTVGEGTAFTIYLPVVPETSEIPILETYPRGQGCVLVTEDDPFVRESVGYYLDRIGFTPLLACDREQALRLAGAHGEAVRVFLTDVMMPQQFGRDLALEIRNVLGDVRVVYMSAHPREELIERGCIDSAATLLQKPFEERQLGVVLSSVLKE